MMTKINTEPDKDGKMKALRINGAFRLILLRYATKMEVAARQSYNEPYFFVFDLRLRP